MIASKTVNIKTLIVPYANMGEVCNLSKLLLEEFTILFVKNIE